MSTPPLRPKRARFAEEFLVDLNGTQAAIRAGYSPRTANEQAARLLATASVSLAIQAAKAARARRVEITADAVLQEMAYLGFSDIRHYQLDDKDNIVLAEGAPDYAMRAVASIRRKRRFIPTRDGPPIEEREVEFRLWDKNYALTNLSKHLGLLVEPPPQGTSITLNLIYYASDTQAPIPGNGTGRTALAALEVQPQDVSAPALRRFRAGD